MSILRFALDEADIAAALKTGDLYIRNVLGFRIEPQVFFEIMFGNQLSLHRFPINFPIANECDVFAFDYFAKRVRTVGDERANPMDDHEHNRTANREQEWSGAIDCAR